MIGCRMILVQRGWLDNQTRLNLNVTPLQIDGKKYLLQAMRVNCKTKRTSLIVSEIINGRVQRPVKKYDMENDEFVG